MMSRSEAEAKFQNLSERFETSVAALATRCESDFKAVSTKQEADLKSLANNQESSLAPIREKLSLIGKPNWTVLLGGIGIAISVVSAVFLVINLSISLAVSPLKSDLVGVQKEQSSFDLRIAKVDDTTNQRLSAVEIIANSSGASKTDRAQLNERLRTVEQLVTGSTQADVASRADRTQLNQRVTTLETTMAAGQADRRATEAALKSSLSEVEGQLCAQDNIRNLTHATDLRTMTLMWNRLKMGDYPSGTVYYPEICNKSLYSSVQK